MGDYSDSDYLRRLAEGVRQYHAQVTEAEERKKIAESSLEDARQRLAASEQFYKMELQRLGHKEEQVRLLLNEDTRFAGMSPREACLRLLKERGKLTLDQLAEQLKAGGFVFKKGSPRRIINMALMRVQEVERGPSGIFRYHRKGS